MIIKLAFNNTILKKINFKEYRTLKWARNHLLMPKVSTQKETARI